MDPISPVHTETVIPDQDSRTAHIANEISRTASWMSTIIVVLVVAMLLEIGFSTYSLVNLSNKVNHNAKTASLQSCADGNEVRREFLAFLDTSLGRSEKAAQALIASKTSTPEQRTVAVRNLASLKKFLADAHKTTTPVRCIYPPAPTPFGGSQ